MTKKLRNHLAAHFKKRIASRYGITINRHDYNALCQRIHDRRDCVLMFRESNARTHWVMNIQGQLVYVVYNSTLHGLCTALPKRALNAVLQRPEILADEGVVRRWLERMAGILEV